MKFDPAEIIEAAKPLGVHFNHVVCGPIQEWRGLLDTCEDWCTWYSGFSLLEGSQKLAVCISSVHYPERMITMAYLEPHQAAHILKIVKNQLVFDHKKGCRRYKTK